jgi:hypothetical protein
MGEKSPVKFSLTMGFPRHCRVVQHAAKLRHGTDCFTSPPKKFFARKIRLFRPGLNPQTWVPEASMLTARPPKPLSHVRNFWETMFHLAKRQLSKLMNP